MGWMYGHGEMERNQMARDGFDRWNLNGWIRWMDGWIDGGHGKILLLYMEI